MSKVGLSSKLYNLHFINFKYTLNSKQRNNPLFISYFFDSMHAEPSFVLLNAYSFNIIFARLFLNILHTQVTLFDIKDLNHFLRVTNVLFTSCLL